MSVQYWVGSDVKNNLGPQSPTSCDSASELLCELSHTYRTLFSEHEVYLGLKSPFNSACSRRSGFSRVRCPGFSVNPGFKLNQTQGQILCNFSSVFPPISQDGVSVQGVSSLGAVTWVLLAPLVGLMLDPCKGISSPIAIATDLPSPTRPQGDAGTCCSGPCPCCTLLTSTVFSPAPGTF